MYIDENVWKEYLAGSVELFEKIAKSFLQNYKNYKIEIEENIKQNNVEELHNQLHSLKGITLNLGMKKLYDETEKTLVEIRKNIIDKKQFASLLDCFTKTYSELASK